MLHLLCIKVNQKFDFENYLHWFNDKTITKIKQFKYHKDQVVAFTSELIKYYYLAMFLNKTPSTMHIQYNSYGRPFIANTNIDFNISHSGEYIMLVISDISRVGIDLEIRNIHIDAIELGKIAFSDCEQNIVADNTDKFFTVWTKKEALIKAYGIGFSTKDYTNTKLTLSPIEELPTATIHSTLLFSNYYFALCILKNHD